MALQPSSLLTAGWVLVVLWLTSHDTWTETNRGVNSFATAPICWNGKSTASKHWDLTIRFMNCNFDILGAIRRAQFQTHPTAGSCFSGAIMWSNLTSFFHFASMYFLVTFGDFWMACHGWSWFAMACQPKMGNILTTYDGYDIQAIPAFFSKMARRSCQFFLMEPVGRLSDSGMQAWFCL